MKPLLIPILFAIGTALCWGCYGPVISKAQPPKKPDGEKLYTPFKPYVGIGVAYVVFAIIGGVGLMYLNGDSFSFTEEGHKQAGIWGFLGGSLGALGALCLTSAMVSFNGPPKHALVMPIVFGGAVSITAIISIIQNRHETAPSIWLWVGMVGVVVSIVLVAANTPHGHGKKPEASKTAPNNVAAAEEGTSPSPATE